MSHVVCYSHIDSVPVIVYKSGTDGILYKVVEQKKIYANSVFSDSSMVFSAIVIIFLILKWWGQVPILRPI